MVSLSVEKVKKNAQRKNYAAQKLRSTVQKRRRCAFFSIKRFHKEPWRNLRHLR
jgi:hypothetical protein